MNVRSMFPVILKSRVKIARARLFESLGSTRYSWPALNGLDRKLAEILPQHGVFLEIGAADGYSQSNTYFLERIRGWSGILIEPLGRQERLCQRLRRGSFCVNTACVASENVGPVTMADQHLMSVMLDRPVTRLGTRVWQTSPRVAVPTTTLSSVIDWSPYSVIDFMSVDVEGAELDVLAGLDFARHAPHWLLVETDRVDEVASLCRPWGLGLVDQLSHHDYLFARQANLLSGEQGIELEDGAG